MVPDAVQRLDDAAVAHCLRGAFDLNCKCAPTMAGYALDHAEAAEEALALGMGGLVFRDDGYCTTPIASLLAETRFHGEPISLAGSVTLNNVSGGLNFYAAEHALALGGRLVSMPTVSAENHLRTARWPAFHDADGMPGPRALTAVDDRGAVRGEVIEVLEIIAERDGVLDAGALHVSEVLALFREAGRRGVKRLLLSDPARRNAADAADIDEAIDLGAAVEFLPQAAGTAAAVLELVARRAPGRLILGLDTGPSNERLSLRERYARAVRFWFALGLSPSTIAVCMSSNVQQLAALPANGARRTGDLP
jgi:hypothetical protein